ncbi:MAG: protease modulator HflC [Calditrichaeota bacterium]|nr:protease modulator HflC [Calditrichota bacterium]MCB0294767.1 protease modulator HflC [Calditrichota bacterium]MCB9089020.1 protease modulator HflC [Calditrichia bacterium]
MNNSKSLFIIIVVLAVLIVIFSAAYTVNETQQVVITQFGETVGAPISEPGIHFKIPLVQKANFFDKRFLEWDGDRDQVPTKDRRFIWVDTYARWRIDDPLLFLQRVTNERGAQSRLDDILDSETKSAIARYDLVELIRTSNRDPQIIDELRDDLSSDQLSEISAGREQILSEIISAAAPKLKELGIELLDLRFKRIKFLDEVQQRIFERMIAERRRIAEKFRSEGQGEASRILGNKERDLKEIQSDAYRQAEEIKGKADAEATAIYASAYDRDNETREFYRFLKTMETYEATLSEKDLLILSTKSDFFKFLRTPSGR